MSKYYTSQRTDRFLYNKNSEKPFKLSRSKIDLFIECPRCFYLDRVLGTGRPPGFPFALNSAVDHLLKQEFDLYRANNTPHPLITKYGIDARPVFHEELNNWRDNFNGVQFLHTTTNFLVYGAIDDLWINSRGEFIVVDYKSTSKDEEIKALDKDWHDGYKRQMEIYQWLLKQKGYDVCKSGYFVYCNGNADKHAFDGKLEFEVTLIEYKGDCSWVENELLKIKKCLESYIIPQAGIDCDYCEYFTSRSKHEIHKHIKNVAVGE